MEILAYISIGFLIGWFSNSIIVNLSNHNKNKKIVDNISKQYLESLQNIRSNKVVFKSRVNQTVYISTIIKDYGNIDIVYLIDRKDVAIFKDNKCIYTSHSIDPQIVSDIITSIRIRFNSEINDVVEVLGITISKSDFGKMFNMDVKDIESQQNIIKKFQEDQKSDIQKIIEKNEKKMSMDDILDKIGKVGYDNLSPDEKEFLKNQS